MARRFFLFLLLSACSTIPKIRFMDDDAEVDATITDDGASDAIGSDAGDAQTPTDAAVGCPDAVPPGAVVCCGAIPCGNAYCSMTACTNCQTKCAVGTLCCPNMGGQANCVLDASCN